MRSIPKIIGSMGAVYPFSAIVGQESMKLALLLNTVNPGIGGVLIRGEKGTAKSTAVRSLAALLPQIATFAGCPFSCDPAYPEEWCPLCRKASEKTIVRRGTRLVTLPLNATEDMVAGGIDFSKTMKSGLRSIQPGLLARAHRGILYVDEVNLLDDHLVDLVLDAAASGANTIEREGVSFRHASRFTLVGTMNPEEGQLRPQLLDRFGLCVEAVSERDPSVRVELMERRDRFELNPAEFLMEVAEGERETSKRLAAAHDLLPRVRVKSHLRSYIGELANSQHVAGHRADLAIEQAARARAAWEGRSEADLDDVLAVAEMVLMHRRRDALPPPPPPHEHSEAPPESNPPPDSNSNDAEQEESEPAPAPTLPIEQQKQTAGDGGDTGEGSENKSDGDGSLDRTFPVGEAFPVKKLIPVPDRLLRRGSGRRSRSRTNQKQGRYVRSHITSECGDLALDATLRAAAPYQATRRTATGPTVIIHRQDWREKVREKRVGTFILFVVDASGSMGSRGRMTACKGAIMSLLLDAYQKRDRIAMVSFRRQCAQLLLPPTSSVEVAAKLLGELPVGGRTPLSAGLVKGHEVLRVQLRHDPNLHPLVILITDGKSNVALNDDSPIEEALRIARCLGLDRRIQWIVVDSEEPGIVRLDLARQLAGALGGEYFRIDGLRAGHLIDVLKERIS